MKVLGVGGVGGIRYKQFALSWLLTANQGAAKQLPDRLGMASRWIRHAEARVR